jgi:hypothetical protein
VIQLSIRVLTVGLVLAALLAVAANAFTLPAWSIYVLFVTIIGITAVVWGRENEARARADARHHQLHPHR